MQFFILLLFFYRQLDESRRERIFVRLHVEFDFSITTLFNPLNIYHFESLDEYFEAKIVLKITLRKIEIAKNRLQLDMYHYKIYQLYNSQVFLKPHTHGTPWKVGKLSKFKTRSFLELIYVVIKSKNQILHNFQTFFKLRTHETPTIWKFRN